MIARLAASLCLLALAAPGAALAQGGGAFQPLPPAPPEQPTTQAPTSSADTDEGLSDTQQLLIAISGLVLLFGIGWAIVRDARSAAPVLARGRAGEEERNRPKGSQKPARVRHQQSRSKAKAARQARKKARKR
ncbi:MAG TPA: hypothetical protein VF549_02170 [Solirubrobacteraceae bacterium]|jgi:hypothetical protein